MNDLMFDSEWQPYNPPLIRVDCRRLWRHYHVEPFSNRVKVDAQ